MPTIPQLDLATTPLAGTEEIVVQQNGQTKRAPVSAVSGGAVNGRIPVVMANVNVTLSAVPYSLTRNKIAGAIIKLSGTGVGTPDITLPDVTVESDAYVLVIERWMTSGTVRLRTPSGGFTWTLNTGVANGAPTTVVVTPDGVTAYGHAEGNGLAVQYQNSTGYMAGLAMGGALQVLRVNGTATGFEFAAVAGFTPPTGTGVVTVTGGVLDAASTATSGTGNIARVNTPTFVTPVLGAATATSVAASSFQSVGGTPATAGSFRDSQGSAGRMRNSGGTFDLYIWKTDNSGGDALYLGGDGSVTNNSFDLLLYYPKTQISCGIGVTDILKMKSTGMQFGSGAVDHGGGTMVIGVDNATVDPTTNATGGGILYASSGAGKWRGSGGTVTTFGAAEPHCPRCGTDVGISQSENDLFGEELIHCHACELRTGNGVVRHFADFFERKAA